MPDNEINYIKIIFGIFGGLALFLYGIDLMSEALKKSTSSRIRYFIKKATKNPLYSTFTGIVSTFLIQSSSAVSIMVIGLIQAEIISFINSYGILLGAAIGTTITVQIISFKITDYSLLIIATGFFLKLFTKKKSLQSIGNSLFGFGLIFFGMYLMSESVAPLKEWPLFTDILLKMENPLIGVIVGIIATAIIQSSGAFIGLLIVLASQNLLSFTAAIPLMLGSNIGTTSTAFLASINSGIVAKRVAFLFLIIKLIGVLLVIGWIPKFAFIVESFSSDVVSRQIANAHTLFNVFMALLLMPFNKIIPDFILKIIPDKPQKIIEPVKTKFIDESMLAYPIVAIGLARQETIYMSEIVRRMMEKMLKPFTDNDSKVIQQLNEDEVKIDFLRKKISDYLTLVGQKDIHKETLNETFQILYIITELEEISDVISDIICPKATEWCNGKYEFSEEGKNELLFLYSETITEYDLAIDAFKNIDFKAAKKLNKEYHKTKDQIIALKQKHFERLTQNIPQSVHSSRIHIDLVGAMRIINSHSANIGKIMLKKYENN
jgi:phosphate:Na+ symporter